MSQNLDNLFDDLLEQIMPEESQLDDIRSRVMADHEIDILSVYCLNTGKQIGVFHDSEIEEAIKDESNEDFESLCDAMLIRTIASMRPSPAWNKPDVGTIRQVVDRRPVDAFAYLLNRLEGSKDLLTKRNDNAISALIARIRNWHKINNLANLNQFDLIESYIHWLLELDSKMNLHDLRAPEFEKDSKGEWKVCQSGIILSDAIQFPEALKAFESWVFDQLKIYSKRQSEAQAQMAWTRGNKMTGPAFVKSSMSHPEIANRKDAALLKRYGSVELGKQIESEKSLIALRKKRKDAEVDDLLAQVDQILAGNSQIKLPVRKAPLKAGGLKFLQKKESN